MLSEDRSFKTPEPLASTLNVVNLLCLCVAAAVLVPAMAAGRGRIANGLRH